MNDMICKKCGDPTNEAPLEKWVGYCPLCVMEVFWQDMTPREIVLMLAQAVESGQDVTIGLRQEHDSSQMKVIGRRGKIVEVETTVSLN